MTAIPESLPDLVASHMMRITLSNAAIFEADCSVLLQSDDPCFVRAAEGAVADAGLLVAGQTLLPTDPKERLARALEAGKKIAAVDFKVMAMSLGQMAKTGGCYYYMINCSPQQRQQCAAVIVHSLLAPQLVAVIPLYYLNKSGRQAHGETESRSFTGRKIPYFGEGVEPFPLEWSPFVMPMEFVGRAMGQLRRFAAGTVARWKNPYNDIVFDNCPRPPLVSPRVLLPPEQSLLTDHAFLESLRCAFRSHGGEYRIAPPCVRASSGDLVVTHMPSRTRAMIEVKRQLLRFPDSRTIEHDAEYWHGRSGQGIFHAFTPWDFLLSTASREGKAILISRDDLPRDWFQGPPSVTRAARFTKEFLEQHTLRDIEGLTNRQAGDHARKRLAHGMIAIFDRYRQDGRFEARTRMGVPPTPPAGEGGAAEGSAVLGGRAAVRDSPPSAPGRQESEEARDGCGTLFERRMYPSRQAALLNRLCAESENYAVYELGRHPSATHVFALGRASSIVDLHPDTPMIYLNFAQVDMLQFRLHDKRRPSSFFHATHGRSKSIFILNPVPDDLDGPPHDYFVLPSEALDTESRRRLNDEQLKQEPWRTSRRATWLTLNNGEPLFVYRTARRDLEATLLRVFRQPLDRQDVFLGDEKTGLGTKISVQEYVQTQRAVLEEYILLLEGGSFHRREEEPFDESSSGECSSSDESEDGGVPV
ncbi:uncharacterized protein A1O5_09736 [Cladophialophora psammophila CBS 110553]|uniref:Uncharacterized protein n=1 Tax=Cladophialophora psammophila CBS 110553 TaxID=1182543 RepID=W9WQ17_9EURO|nr:uncharacterized protein A1O5_09736 [Cladophialophora psammophila CBS 110553]EXJ67090.1 hypothetical protein A1O5_09736 [Cladophialophora psammophila CBS 110553]